MAEIFSFQEHDVTISAEKEHLIALGKILEQADVDNVWSDLAYQIRMKFDEEFSKEVSEDGISE